MAQAAARVGPTEVRRSRNGYAARLFKVVSDRVILAYRRSRERDELATAMSRARAGRETGVKC